jgi:hypothetical protein
METYRLYCKYKGEADWINDFRIPKPFDISEGIESDFEILNKVSDNFSMIHSRMYSMVLIDEMIAENGVLRKEMTNQVFEYLEKRITIKQDFYRSKKITEKLLKDNIRVRKYKWGSYHPIEIPNAIRIFKINDKYYLIRQRNDLGHGFMTPSLLLFFSKGKGQMIPVPTITAIPAGLIALFFVWLESGRFDGQIVLITFITFLAVQILFIPLVYYIIPKRLHKLLYILDEKRRKQ